MPRLNNQRLAGPQLAAFRAALLDAFDLQRLDEMLLYQLSKQRERLSLARDLETIVFDVIQRAELESWTAALLGGALASAPHNGLLLKFAQTVGAAPATVELERIIRAQNAAFDPAPWLARLAERLGQVCCIEQEGRWPAAIGTGFLVAPDVVMTNYHVAQAWIAGTVAPAKMRLRFDYKRVGTDVALHPGTLYRLAPEQWLIDASPPGADRAEPAATELDYALLLLDSAAGHDPIGGPTAHDPNTPPRGWIRLPAAEDGFPSDSSLFILGHPVGDSLKLALETQAVIGLNAAGTRVRYRTNTQGGSSGSPCFDHNWHLLALHHAGDPAQQPLYNQGIPLAAIRRLWQTRLADHALAPWQAQRLQAVLEG